MAVFGDLEGGGVPAPDPRTLTDDPPRPYIMTQPETLPDPKEVLTEKLLQGRGGGRECTSTLPPAVIPRLNQVR